MTADERLALVRLKIERANKHIDDLQASLRAFGESNPYKITTKRDPQTRKLIYYLVSADPVPAVIPSIAGDVLNSLRSALDHLAQQLYLVGTGNAQGYRDKTSFPISPSAKDFKNVLARKVEGMRKDAIDAICAIEPYGGGKGDDLWTFHRLNNIDKHRLMVAAWSKLQGVGLPVTSRIPSTVPPHVAALMKAAASNIFLRPADQSPLKAGDELYIGAPDDEPDQDQKFSIVIAVYEPGIIEGKPILETLMQFRDRINGIVEAFRPCLK